MKKRGKKRVRRKAKPDSGWLIILRPDMDAAADGVEDEAWTTVFRDLDRAKEDCNQYIRDRMKDEPEIESDVIQWAEDPSSDERRRVYFGRPRAIDDEFYIYQVAIE